MNLTARIEMEEGSDNWRHIGDLVLTDQGIAAKPAPDDDPEQFEANEAALQHDLTAGRRRLERQWKIGKSDLDFLENLWRLMGSYGRVELSEDGEAREEPVTNQRQEPPAIERTVERDERGLIRRIIERILPS